MRNKQSKSWTHVRSTSPTFLNPFLSFEALLAALASRSSSLFRRFSLSAWFTYPQVNERICKQVERWKSKWIIHRLTERKRKHTNKPRRRPWGQSQHRKVTGLYNQTENDQAIVHIEEDECIQSECALSPLTTKPGCIRYCLESFCFASVWRVTNTPWRLKLKYPSTSKLHCDSQGV